jgi:hypothetical protein
LRVSTKKATKLRDKNPDLKTFKEMLLFNIDTEKETNKERRNDSKKRKTFAMRK